MTDLEQRLKFEKSKAKAAHVVSRQVKRLIREYNGPVAVFNKKGWFTACLVGDENYQDLMWSVEHEGKDWHVGTYAPGVDFQSVKDDVIFSLETA